MRKYIKRFKLSEWLIVLQLVSSIAALLLSLTNNFIADAFGLVWNIVTAGVLLVVFLRSNARNYKSYEVTGQFIFNKLGDSFSDFMDFLMSGEYMPDSFEEQTLLQNKLLELSEKGDYDTKRKISRALPNLYEIDKKMAYDIALALRRDIAGDNSTDIRRRTNEAILQIIQRQKVKKQKRTYKKYKDFFAYLTMDDSYTVVSGVEGYFYCYAFVAKKDREKRRILADFEALKSKVAGALKARNGRIVDTLPEEMDAIWDALEALYRIGHSTGEACGDAKKHVEEVLGSGGKFTKLAVVKNLYYSCDCFPRCLWEKECSTMTSQYMMERISDFLTNAMEGDIFLSMPTVRYFDCVCSNFRQKATGKLSHGIVRKYYTHSDLLINQTAFDKFAMVMAEEPAFGREVLEELLENNERQLAGESEMLTDMIRSLPEESRGYFSVSPGRMKIKRLRARTYKEKQERESIAQVAQIDGLLDKHYERIRFVGKIKKMREELGG